ncbi:hypothetical protein BB558_002514 [Smittium angustum]|uniref:Uncharacterized protein n=1 Tax=Smittium angustum TaxID=133377 RepID=A0A2U1J8G8_SMIAN|nr:hypothetical protein BB558_002514 [Smittium angustum]
MFQNKNPAFGVRPRVATRQLPLSNENAALKPVVTRSKSIKDSLPSKTLANDPKQKPSFKPSSIHPKSFAPSLQTTRSALSDNIKQTNPSLNIQKLKNTSSNVIVTRSRSINSDPLDHSTSHPIPTNNQKKLDQFKTSSLKPTRPTSISVKSNSYDSSDNQTKIAATRRIAKPSSLYSTRRSQFSKSVQDLSPKSIANSRPLATRRPASSASNHTNNSLAVEVVISEPHTRSSSTNSQATKVDLYNYSGSSAVNQYMEVDDLSENTIKSDDESIESDSADNELLISDSDDEVTMKKNIPSSTSDHSLSTDHDTNILPHSDSPADNIILYSLQHSGLNNEVPITPVEINNFESDVDPNDTTLVPAFSDDIFMYMKELENSMMPKDNYMDRQPELAWSMRTILVDWLVQVHDRFRLLPETLFLTVNFVDRFLSIKTVQMHKLQLVGAVSLLLASKYEEIQVPSISEIVYMTENAYTADEVIRAERYVLRMLNFDLGWPGPMSFLRRISKADDYDLSTRTLAKYLLEVTLMDEYFISVPCSMAAAMAHYLSIRLLNKGSWTRAHAFYSGYFESEIYQYLPKLINLLKTPKCHKAIYEKYSDKKYMRASEYVSQWFSRNSHESLLSLTLSDIKPQI